MTAFPISRVSARIHVAIGRATRQTQTSTEQESAPEIPYLFCFYIELSHDEPCFFPVVSWP